MFLFLPRLVLPGLVCFSGEFWSFWAFLFGPFKANPSVRTG